MSQYYLQFNEITIFTLDATTQMSYTMSGKTTDSPIESGESVSDHYVNLPEVITLSGVITDMVSLGQSPEHRTPADFIKELRFLKTTGTPFSVWIGTKLENIPNCVFTSLRVSQSDQQGSRVFGEEEVLSAYKVDMSFKQIRFGGAATLEKIPKQSIKDDASGKISSPETTKKVEPLEQITIRERIGLFEGDL